MNSNVQFRFYRLLFFMWCFCWCCFWSGNTVFAETVLSTSSDASLIDADGNILDGTVIDDIPGGSVTIVNNHADLSKVESQLASISNAVRSLTATRDSSAYDVSLSVAQYFDRVANGVGPKEDYVLARLGNYRYCMYIGDIDLSGTNFSGTARTVIYDYSGSTSYWHFNDESDFTLSAGTHLVFSSLGDYPRLGDDTDEDKANSFLLFTGFMFMLCYSIFSLCVFKPFSLGKRGY